MPWLDVSDLMTDPDFVELDLICQRNAQTVGAGGLAANATTSIPFTGVVTSERGDVLERLADGERIIGTIMIVTRFRLRDGRGADVRDGEPAITADVVLWRGRAFTVVDANDYTHFGRGFVQARCDLLPLSGGTA
jgi:hypothetical protein